MVTKTTDVVEHIADDWVAGSAMAAVPSSDTTTYPGDYHLDGDTEECDYTPALWDGTASDLASGANSQLFREYVEIAFDSDVRFLSDGDPIDQGPYWLIDDVTENMYAYWMEPLAPQTQTTDYTTEITLVASPNGDDPAGVAYPLNFYYALHADLDPTLQDAPWQGMDPTIEPKLFPPTATPTPPTQKLRIVPEIENSIFYNLSTSAYAIANDGTLYSWGFNYLGTLGDGTTNNALSPVHLDASNFGGRKVEMLAGGNYSALALDEDGNVWAWGSHYTGLLGDGVAATAPRLSPAMIDMSALGGRKIVKISSFHGSNVLALADDGTLWAWGANDCGQVGDGTTDFRNRPVQVPCDFDGQAIVSFCTGDLYSILATADGSVWVWGDNTNSGGHMINGINSLSPIKLDQALFEGKPIKKVYESFYNGFAIAEDGTVYGWGNNESGAMGDNFATWPSASTPTKPACDFDGEKVVMISAGDEHVLALTESGTLWVWGSAARQGQLGIGSYDEASTPVKINTFGGKKIITIGAGYRTSYAVDEDGYLWCCGNNMQGQYGNGTTDCSTTFVQTINPPFRQLSATP
jgi:hypothetical protein